MHKARYFYLFFLNMCRVSLCLKATFFSRIECRQKKTVGAYSHIFSRHAKIDHRQFFHLSIFLSVSLCPVEDQRSEKVKKREGMRGGSTVRMNIDGPSRVWASPRLFPSRISHRIVSDTKDLYLPPRPTTFSVD